MFRRYVLPPLVFLLYRSLVATWRLKIVEPNDLKARLKNQDPAVFAIWHGDEMVMINLVRFYPTCTMTSTSKDGTLMDRVLLWLGSKTSRGSSTRGAVTALKGIIRLAKKEKRIPVFAVDGPKGPIHQIKPGVFELSRLLKAPIFPSGVASSSSWRSEKSWNRASLPKPFAKVVVVWGEPFYWDFKNTDTRDQELALSLKKSFNTAAQEARRHLAEA